MFDIFSFGRIRLKLDNYLIDFALIYNITPYQYLTDEERAVDYTRVQEEQEPGKSKTAELKMKGRVKVLTDILTAKIEKG